jgi:two-component system chemotaxis response regulator CheB
MNTESNGSRIKVLIVDDSAFMRTALSRMVAHDPGLWVIGTAASGIEALQKIVALDPDVITLDVEMPGLDGLETLRRIMAQFPRPVIMVSSATLRHAEITFNALAAGAFDYVPKKLSAASLDIWHIQEDLVAKIKAAAESWLSRNHLNRLRKPPRAATLPGADLLKNNLLWNGLPRTEIEHCAPAIVALGTSTGGPRALQEILPALPVDLAVPILIVQHMPPGFTAPFAKRLNDLCAVSVREASHGDTVEAGVVYIAPAGFHMTVECTANSRTIISLSGPVENQAHIPSVDVTMQSVASAFHSQAMGIIMTGMGSDGAQGMNAIHREGGFTVGQDQPTCAVYGMPRVCAEMGILDRIVPLSEIPQEILQATRYRKTNVV